MSLRIIEREKELRKSSLHTWSFYDNNYCYWTAHCRCEECGNFLESAYSSIITKLIEKKLLSEDFKVLCCICNFYMKVLGFTHCKDCNEGLSIKQTIDNIEDVIVIYCDHCNKIYYEDSAK